MKNFVTKFIKVLVLIFILATILVFIGLLFNKLTLAGIASVFALLSSLCILREHEEYKYKECEYKFEEKIKQWEKEYKTSHK